MSILYNGVDSFKNKIINGNFDIWQRATSQSFSGYGSDDRWTNVNNGSTKVHSRQSFTLGQTEVPNNPKSFSRTVVTSVAGANNHCIKQQRIEDVILLSDKTFTLSFWAKADSNKNIAVEFLQNFATSGTPSEDVNGINVTTFSLTTSWQKFTSTVTFPSVTGKTLGTDGNSSSRIYFWFDAGSTYDSRTNSLGQQSGTFDIAQVQLEEGSIATQFENRPLNIELLMCQRYYEQSTTYYIQVQNGNARHNQYILSAFTTTSARMSGNFLTNKRYSGGTWTIYRTSDGTTDNQAAVYTSSWLSSTNVVATCAYSQGWHMTITMGSGVFAGWGSYMCSVGWAYDCEL